MFLHGYIEAISYRIGVSIFFAPCYVMMQMFPGRSQLTVTCMLSDYAHIYVCLDACMHAYMCEYVGSDCWNGFWTYICMCLYVDVYLPFDCTQTSFHVQGHECMHMHALTCMQACIISSGSGMDTVSHIYTCLLVRNIHEIRYHGSFLLVH